MIERDFITGGEIRVVKVTWPTLIGGAFDGRPIPDTFEADSKRWQEVGYPIEQRDESWGTVTYILHHPKFTVMSQVIRVAVLAHEDMTTYAVAWHLLCCGLGVPEARR